MLNRSALAGCLLVTLAPNLYVALAGFMLVGIGVCASYPLTTSAAARLGDRPSSQNVASLTMAVQVSGKTRGTISVPRDVTQEEALATALADPSIAKFVIGTPRKVIFVPGRMLNVVL